MMTLLAKLFRAPAWFMQVLMVLLGSIPAADYLTFLPLVWSNLPATWEHYGTVIAALPLMHQLSPFSGPSTKRVIFATKH